MSDTSAQPDETSAPPTRWLAVIVLAVVLLAIAFSQTALRRGDQADDRPAPANPQTGKLVYVELRDDSETGVYPTDWVEGMTALAALEAAVGGDAVERTGEGGQAFVNAIRSKENEGAGGRNWQYFVNGERATVSAGAQPVSPGDRVLWSFAPYE